MEYQFCFISNVSSEQSSHTRYRLPINFDSNIFFRCTNDCDLFFSYFSFSHLRILHANEFPNIMVFFSAFLTLFPLIRFFWLFFMILNLVMQPKSVAFRFRLIQFTRISSGFCRAKLKRCIRQRYMCKYYQNSTKYKWILILLVV